MLVAEDCLLSAVSPLSDVVWQTRYDDTCKSDHDGTLRAPGWPAKNYV